MENAENNIRYTLDMVKRSHTGIAEWKEWEAKCAEVTVKIGKMIKGTKPEIQ